MEVVVAIASGVRRLYPCAAAVFAAAMVFTGCGVGGSGGGGGFIQPVSTDGAAGDTTGSDVVADDGAAGGADVAANTDSGSTSGGNPDVATADAGTGSHKADAGGAADVSGVDAGGCVVTNGGKEKCDGVDNNCDGATDEQTCDDNNECTSESCAGPKGCASKDLVSGPCEDGSGCTVGDSCSKGICLGGAAKTCNDANPCTTDKCDAKSGNCTFVAVADGTGCGGDKTCKSGACGGGCSVKHQEKCHQGSVWWFDCKGTASSIASACKGDEYCPAGSQKCAAPQYGAYSVTANPAKKSTPWGTADYEGYTMSVSSMGGTKHQITYTNGGIGVILTGPMNGKTLTATGAWIQSDGKYKHEVTMVVTFKDTGGAKPAPQQFVGTESTKLTQLSSGKSITVEFNVTGIKK